MIAVTPDAAALAPSSARPDLMTMTGLLRAAARAADMNLRVCVTDSTYIMIARALDSLPR